MKLHDKQISRRRIMTVCIFAVIQMLALISPRIMQIMVDDYIPNKKSEKIVAGIILFVMIPLVMVALKTFYNYATIKYVRKKGNDYSLRIMENIVYEDMSFFEDKKSIETLSYISKEMVQYINFYVVELSQFYVHYVMASVTVFEVFRINILLGLFQLLYIPLTILPTRRIMKNVEGEISSVVEKNAIINQIKGDTLRAIDLVKSYRLEEKRISEVDKHNRQINSIWGKVAALDTLSNIWSFGFMTALFTGVSFGFGSVIMLYSDKITIGQLVSLITYSSLFYSSINSIIQTKIEKKKQDSEFNVVLSYLNLPGEREDNKGKKAFDLKNEICFKNCTYSYKEGEYVFKNLNVTFRAGKWTGIVGTSGKGKTTILDLILRLYKVPANMVFVDGQDINEIDAFSIRDKVTRVNQESFLFPGSIRENLLLANPNASEKDMLDVIEFSGLSDYISNLPNGIDTDIGEIGKLMSGGERQRLSLAMGLIRKNKVLLLDEVTSNLDPDTEALLAENFSKLKEKGYTIVSVSHKREFLKYADCIFDIDEQEQ